MNAALPKYMTVKDFCCIPGFPDTNSCVWPFKAGVVIKRIGPGHIEDWRSKMVDVAAALAAIEALPEADKEVPMNLQAGAVAQEETEAAE